jgi:hypothetical protein
MRRQNFFQLVMIASLAPISSISIAAELDPVGKKIDNSQVMERVALIGVIAGGSAASGVAVIKDTQTGRTYAIKAGDNLPGVRHIKLRNIKRELAVFDVEGKEYQVRLSVGGHAQEADDEADVDLDVDIAQEDDGPGLFEKWNGTGVHASDDHVEHIDASRAQLSHKTVRDKNNINGEGSGLSNNNDIPHTDAVVGLDEKAKTDAAANLRKDKAEPVNAIFDDLTTGRTKDNKLGRKIDAANANKKKVEALNVNGAVHTGAAE